jgi:peptidoglycan/LPS O-acetylase OafA/YrhL
MVFLGRVSYSTYLFHWLVMHGLLHVLPGSLLLPFILIFSALFVGSIIYALVERPLMKSRHQLAKRFLPTLPGARQLQPTQMAA